MSVKLLFESLLKVINIEGLLFKEISEQTDPMVFGYEGVYYSGLPLIRQPLRPIKVSAILVSLEWPHFRGPDRGSSLYRGQVKYYILNLGLSLIPLTTGMGTRPPPSSPG